MNPYRVVVNAEWTSKCNALCAMCPREMISHPQMMTRQTWQSVLQRLQPQDVFRTVIAGYGEPTTHRQFFDMVDDMRQHPVRFDMVSNGQLLDAKHLSHLDGAIALLVISFSSIVPAVYQKVHVKLNHSRVMEHIQLAQKTLKHTQLAISLTPMSICLPSLPDTITWLREQGVNNLTMSPTLYNRAGSLQQHQLESTTLRDIIARYRLHSQELDFVPSIPDVLKQCYQNNFKCLPRNSDVFIAANGDYLYCYNDVSHQHSLGHVSKLRLRDVLNQREAMSPIASLCDTCNMRNRYNWKERVKVAGTYIVEKSWG